VKAWFTNVRPLVLAGLAALAMAACDEKLDSGLACPVLCPQPGITLRDTTLFAVALDTSIAGYPPVGAETRLYITSMGDTLQTRGIARWDSLPDKFAHVNSAIDSSIVAVDTGAHVRLYIDSDSVRLDPLTVELYDVDMGGAEDSDPSVLASAFTPERFLGARTFPIDSVRDSLNIPILPSALLAKIQTPIPGNRLRVGIRITAASEPTLVVQASNMNRSPLLVFRPDTSETVATLSLPVRSKTPEDPQTRAELADFILVTQTSPPAPADVLRIGGLPARRAYLRFDVPVGILDSTTLVRAALILDQRPNGHSPEPEDSIAIIPYEVTASAALEDLTRALFFLRGLPQGFPARTDSLRMASDDDGTREFQVLGFVRNWRGTDPATSPRALALALNLGVEGTTGRQVDFFSTEAALALRPRLRITYLPRREEGLP
jgi:hypothetical protein